jgi:hypothetical protein
MQLDQWKRRDFIALLGGAATWPVAARAQQAALSVIGYLSSLSQADSVRFDIALRRGLSDMGYVEGQNVSTNTVGLRSVMTHYRQWRPTSCSARWR